MYSQEFLTSRFYDTFASLTSKKKNELVPPKIEKKNRKTMIVNFVDMCKSFNRDQEYIRAYIEKELKPSMSVSGDTDNGVTVSVSGENILIISGSYPQTIITTILTNFVKKFVLCSSCKSTDTAITKENRINYLACNFCRSKKPISH